MTPVMLLRLGHERLDRPAVNGQDPPGQDPRVLVEKPVGLVGKNVPGCGGETEVCSIDQRQRRPQRPCCSVGVPPSHPGSFLDTQCAWRVSFAAGSRRARWKRLYACRLRAYRSPLQPRQILVGKPRLSSKGTGAGSEFLEAAACVQFGISCRGIGTIHLRRPLLLPVRLNGKASDDGLLPRVISVLSRIPVRHHRIFPQHRTGLVQARQVAAPKSLRCVLRRLQWGDQGRWPRRAH